MSLAVLLAGVERYQMGADFDAQFQCRRFLEKRMDSTLNLREGRDVIHERYAGDTAGSIAGSDYTSRGAKLNTTKRNGGRNHVCEERNEDGDSGQNCAQVELGEELGVIVVMLFCFGWVVVGFAHFSG